jgi:acetyltransferase-like isoleucine patch superfamily enzyme
MSHYGLKFLKKCYSLANPDRGRFGRNWKMFPNKAYASRLLAQVSHPVILRALAPGAHILIGDDTGLSGTTICAASSIEIGQGCLMGADVMIVDTDFHPLAPEGRRYAQVGAATAPVRIGNNVFLGARTVVLKGVTIGDNTVVGAGSVVTKDLPENVLAGGNPAHIIRPLLILNAMDEALHSLGVDFLR